MNLNIAYIGSGYVGQVDAAISADKGHNVILVDVIPEKVETINSGKPTIYEQGLSEIIARTVKEKRLSATINLAEAIKKTEISFVCVGTPDIGHRIDLSYIKQAAIDIGKALATITHYHVVVVKSTVVPGTTEDVVLPLLETYSGKKVGKDFGLCMNPEFLREGVAVQDAINPDSVVIGFYDEKSREKVASIYHWIDPKKLFFCGIKAAEAIKYAKNSFLATKITFANEWANYCETIGVDVKEVMEAIGMDRRIGPLFLQSGPGYGGSCFPKDLNAIIHAGAMVESRFRILEKVVAINSIQHLRLIKLAKKIIKKNTFDGMKISVLGLSFKENTDDVRESPALRLINELVAENALVTGFCPEGMPMAKRFLEDMRIRIQYAQTLKEAIQDAELIFIPTPWPQFSGILGKTKCPVIVGHRHFVKEPNLPNVYVLGRNSQ
jgi:UDPglucose 6-dehydrogenase